jgi:hypothetical protein
MTEPCQRGLCLVAWRGSRIAFKNWSSHCRRYVLFHIFWHFDSASSFQTKPYYSTSTRACTSISISGRYTYSSLPHPDSSTKNRQAFDLFMQDETAYPISFLPTLHHIHCQLPVNNCPSPHTTSRSRSLGRPPTRTEPRIR